MDGDSEVLGRIITPAKQGDEALGLLKNLPGKWVGQGRGWNMIALPVDASHSGGRPAFRLLLNQFDETLEFTNELVGNPGGVPNRGTPTDQFLNGLQYIQHVDQLAAVDSLGSNISLLGPGAIHHEPGFFLRLLEPDGTDSNGRPLEYARIGTVPHGDSLAALGNGVNLPGPVNGINLSAAAIGDFSPLPVGAGPQDINANGYLKPYLDFHNNPFKGNVTASGFPGFDPSDPLQLLLLGQPPAFKSMTVIVLDTSNQGGIANLPFIVKQANASDMRFVIWVEELVDSTPDEPKFQLQYAQKVMLDFFPQFGDPTQKIHWPHISINTLTLQSDDFELDIPESDDQ